MIRRHRRRGLMARLRRMGARILARLGGRPPDPRIVELPVRARPERIEFLEEYHFALAVQRHPVYHAEAQQARGEISIRLPFDRIGREALADVALHTATEPGAIDGRYGWLGLADTGDSDLAPRLASVREWRMPGYHAFPLVFPLLDEDEESLEERVEAGWEERERLFYTPQDPSPFPFHLDLFVSRDSAVPTEPRPLDGDPTYRLTGPNGATGKELAFHVRLGFTFARPPTVEVEQITAMVERFHINWPVPVMASQLALRGAEGARLWVDSRHNQVVIDQMPVRLAAGKEGPLQGQLAFRLIVRQPAMLEGKRHLRGKLKVGIEGLALSGLSGQYFDATGAIQDENGQGEPLIRYRSELHAEFDYWLSDVLEEAPVLIERHYMWVPGKSNPDPFREVEKGLQECGFEVDPELSHRQAERDRRWWATRLAGGQPLILDVRMQRVERPLLFLGALAGKGPEVLAGQEPTPHAYVDLTIRGYYRGQWKEVAQQVSWLEERLRQRLHLRHQRQ